MPSLSHMCSQFSTLLVVTSLILLVALLPQGRQTAGDWSEIANQTATNKHQEVDEGWVTGERVENQISELSGDNNDTTIEASGNQPHCRSREVNVSEAANNIRHKKRKNRKNGKKAGRHSRCDTKSIDELKEMLGPAFNGRYMSVDKPVEDNSIIAGGGDEEIMADYSGHQLKQVLPFHVQPDYRREMPPDFYLDVSWYLNTSEAAARLLRTIRSATPDGSDDDQDELPWQCDSQVIWSDLGDNYYPRFLRNVRCTSEKCWFGHFICKPKAFTVNVLKRVRDSCKDGADNRQWVFEERAVTFCCECAEH